MTQHTTNTNRGPDYPVDTIRVRRIALGLTQMKLASALGCHLDTLRSWEQGYFNPSPRYQTLLDEILGAREQEKGQ